MFMKNKIIIDWNAKIEICVCRNRVHRFDIAAGIYLLDNCGCFFCLYGIDLCVDFSNGKSHDEQNCDHSKTRVI